MNEAQAESVRGSDAAGADVSERNAVPAVDAGIEPYADADRPLVLMVDDDPSTRLLAEAFLDAAGFRIADAADGCAGLALIEKLHPDVVLLDVEMPGMDGFTVCERVRAHGRFSTLPIIMTTGREDTASVERAYAVGATDFATKPINWPLLCHRLRYVMRARDTLRQLGSAMRELETSSRSLDEAQRMAELGSWEWCPDSDRMTWSQGLVRVLGLPAGTQPSMAALKASFEAPDRTRLGTLLDELLDRNAAAPQTCVERFRIVRPDGERRIVQQRLETTVADGRGQRRARAALQDITTRQESEARIRELAYFDSLTGLPNRACFRDRLTGEVSRAKRRGTQFATVFVDLDDFKRINDTLGHDAGDVLLKEAAARLVASVRAGNLISRPEVADEDCPVARLGGDEFTLVVSDLDEPGDVVVVAERIVEVLGRSVDIDGHEIQVTPSIGIALYPQDGETADELLKNADTAMYFSKREGKNRYRFFDDAMNIESARRLELEIGLRRALERNELEVHYQPQMDLRADALDGVEALLRWHSPDMGTVSPGEFIPLAEKTGLIVPIGEWVLRTACMQLKRWRDDGLALQRVAVNVSLRQFAQPDFPSVVGRILGEIGLPARSLELEITETLLASDVEGAIGTLNALKALGVQLSIDDFGTGYSSLSHLKRFPIDRLKIDQSFVREVCTDQDDAAIALAVIGMAASMQLNVVAEGVENAAQLQFLRDQHCDEVQGYFVSRPLPPAELEALLRSGSVNVADAAPADQPALVVLHG